ncbi:MAG: RNA polymerase factor sigma-32 [Polyangia bacterium]|jgi:RNA polymerase sigma-32 factor|nr:RNA polymerase factor sigma-32 [Polyangia bacterium]
MVKKRKDAGTGKPRSSKGRGQGLPEESSEQLGAGGPGGDGPDGEEGEEGEEAAAEGDEDALVEDVAELEEALTGEVVAGVPVVDDEAVEADLEPVEVAEPSRTSASTRSLATWDPLTAYIQETRRYSLLTREEEHELAVRYSQTGDMDAARRLVTANLRLVVKIAHEYRKAYQNLLDLVQEGNVGLVQAVQKFDPYRNVKLSTYAAWWIKAYILKFILNNWRMVKIGTTQAQRKLFFNLRKQKEELERQGIKPTAELIAAGLEVSESEVVEMERRLAAPDLSLSAPLGKDDSGGRTYYDVLPEPDLPPDEQVASRQFHDMLKAHLKEFEAGLRNERERVIYRERLMSDTPLTLKEIGDRWNVSRERARQLEKRLLGKLREHLKEKMGDAVEIAMRWET